LEYFLTVRSSILSAELLLEQAVELRTVGLISAAEIIENVASTTPHEWDLPPGRLTAWRLDTRKLKPSESTGNNKTAL
jgi:hypothetical protein